MSENSRIRFSAAGDILITRRITKENEGVGPIYEYLRRADVSVANLEATITDGFCYPSAYSGGTWVTAQKECLKDVARYGFDYLALANNHSMDYSYDGLFQTIQHVEEAGFMHGGTGKSLYEASKPVFIETKQGRVAIINICTTFEKASIAGIQTERQPGRPGLNPLRHKEVFRITKEHLDKLKEIAAATGINGLKERFQEQGFLPKPAEGVYEFGNYQFEIVEKESEEGRFSYPNPIDVNRTVESIREAAFSCREIIIMVHSHEVKLAEDHEADYYLETFAHACIDAGATAVIGSGTHQIKGIEFYKNRPIFYCLGNFIFENEYVALLPADYMQQYGLPIHASGAEGIRRRTQMAEKSLYVIPEVYETVLPYFEMENGVCKKVELLPVELGFELESHKKNLPYPAGEEKAKKILQYLNHACECYGNQWKYENGRFVLEDEGMRMG